MGAPYLKCKGIFNPSFQKKYIEDIRSLQTHKSGRRSSGLLCRTKKSHWRKPMTETSNTAQTLRNIRILQLLGFLIVVGLAVLIYQDATRPVAPVPDTQPANAQGLPEESDLIAASRQVPPEKDFDFIYKEKFWGANAEGQGHSGPGSTVDATLIYRTFLQDFLKVHGIRSVVDAGCGDWEFSRTVDWSGIDYKGFDIVADVIKSNTEKYSKSNVSFAVANMVEDPLPADLLIVNGVLQHIPNRDVLKFLPQLKNTSTCCWSTVQTQQLCRATTKTPPWAVTAIWS